MGDCVTNNELIETIKGERGVTIKTISRGDYTLTVRTTYTPDGVKSEVTGVTNGRPKRN